MASLIDLIGSTGLAVPDEVRESSKLTQYAVRTRYPGVIEPVSEEEFQAAFALANSVVKWVEKVIREPPI